MVFNFSRKEKISPKTSIHAQALKGQGTTEYLVIVGAIIVVALIVTSLTVSFTSGADTAGSTNIKTQLESDIIGITDIISDPIGNVAVTIKNNDFQPYQITKIEINDSQAGFVKLLGTGENQTFVVSAPEECANGKRTVTLKITYKPIDSEIEKVRYIENIPINCEEYAVINPLRMDGFRYYYLVSDFSSGTLTNMTINQVGNKVNLSQNDPSITYPNVTEYPLRNNIVSLWHLDETSGSTMYDSKGTNHGSISGVSFTNGLFGKAYSFNGGSGSYVTKSYNSSLNITGQITLTGWVKVQNYKSTGIYGMNFIYGISGSGFQIRYGLLLDTNGKIGFGNGNSKYYSATTPIPLDTWNHLVVTVNGTTLKFYLNGQLDKTTTMTNVLPTNSGSLTFGKWNDWWGQAESSFVGNLDEAIIYNKALSDSEVNELYQGYLALLDTNYVSEIIDLNHPQAIIKNITLNTTGPIFGEELQPDIDINIYNDLIGLWHFNEAQETTFSDSSINNLHATCTNCPTSSQGLWNTNALHFDGNNDYLTIENNNLLNNKSNITISQWIYIEDYEKAIITLSKDGNSGFYLQIGAGNLNNGQLYVRYGSVAGTIGSTSKITPNKWHHLVITYSPTTLRAYLNGELLGTRTGNAPNGMNDNLFIGAYASDGNTTPAGYYLNGKIEETAIWGRAFSANEVLDLFSRGAARLELKYRSCDDESCSGEEWISQNYSQVTPINISQINQYFQWAIQPSTYLFYEPLPEGCYTQTPTVKTCSGFNSQEACEAQEGWEGDCYWESSPDYCKNDPNYYGYPECYFFSGDTYECELREPACYIQNYCEGYDYYNYAPDCYYFSGDEYECDLRAPACQSNTGCVGYLGDGCYNQYDESSCNSLGFCYWDGYSCYENDVYGACAYNYYDETSCNSAGFCYWDGYSCYPKDCYYAYDEMDCGTIPGGGCYWGHECYNGYNYNTWDSYKCYDYDWPGYEDESLCNNTPGCYWSNSCSNAYDEFTGINYSCAEINTQEENLCNNTTGCFWGSDSFCGAQTGNILPCSMAQGSDTCSYLSGCAFRTQTIEEYNTKSNTKPYLSDLNLSYFN